MRGKRSVRLLPGLAVKLHPLVVLAGNHPEAVVLDLVQPLGAGVAACRKWEGTAWQGYPFTTERPRARIAWWLWKSIF